MAGRALGIWWHWTRKWEGIFSGGATTGCCYSDPDHPTVKSMFIAFASYIALLLIHRPGSVIYSDEWRAYSSLSTISYTHKTVNHSQKFCGPHHWRTHADYWEDVGWFTVARQQKLFTPGCLTHTCKSSCGGRCSIERMTTPSHNIIQHIAQVYTFWTAAYLLVYLLTYLLSWPLHQHAQLDVLIKAHALQVYGVNHWNAGMCAKNAGIYYDPLNNNRKKNRSQTMIETA